MENTYLIHAGIKGMKWGVRKKVESTGNNRAGSKKSNVDSSSQTSKQKSKGKTVAKVLGITAGVGVGATAIAGLVTAGAVLASKAIKNKLASKPINEIKLRKEIQKLQDDLDDMWWI